MIIQLKTILMVILLFTGLASSQTEEEQTKIVLANFVLELDKTVKLNINLTKSIDALITELRAIKEPSAELVAILEKYGIYQIEDQPQ